LAFIVEHFAGFGGDFWPDRAAGKFTGRSMSA
jgi:hypothetical protein